jgi:hypothetical protein
MLPKSRYKQERCSLLYCLNGILTDFGVLFKKMADERTGPIGFHKKVGVFAELYHPTFHHVRLQCAALI